VGGTSGTGRSRVGGVPVDRVNLCVSNAQWGGEVKEGVGRDAEGTEVVW